jgi:hypothetical protein
MTNTRKKKRSNGTLLHIDHVPPHLAKEKIDSLGIHGSSPPPYSPDIALCDFWLFRDIKMKLERMSFATPSALASDFQEILDEIYIAECVKVFHEWEVRLRPCINSGDEYL